MSTTITLNRRTAWVGLCAVLAVGGAFLAGHTLSQAPQPVYAASVSATPTGITVTGIGHVTGTPDVLTVELAVTAAAGDVSTALDEVSSNLAQVRKALTRRRVAAADIQTSDLSVSANTNSDGTQNGYQATESLQVDLRDLKHAGSTITAATAAGGNAVRINGMAFDLRHNSRLLASARTAAFADARAKAKQYADAAHRTLGQVLQVTESDSTQNPSPESRQGSAASVAIDPGTSQVSVSVDVVFALA